MANFKQTFEFGDRVLYEKNFAVSWEGTIDKIKYENRSRRGIPGYGRIKSYRVTNKVGSRWFFHYNYELTLVVNEAAYSKFEEVCAAAYSKYAIAKEAAFSDYKEEADIDTRPIYVD